MNMDWFEESKRSHDEQWIIDHADKVNWDIISAKQKLTVKIIEMFPDKINWLMYSKNNPYLTPEIIRSYAYKIVWSKLREDFYTNVDFLREFWEFIKWNKFVNCDDVGEDLIEEFQDLLSKRDWNDMWDKSFSSEFIRKHLEKLNIEFIYKTHQADEETEELIKGMLPEETIQQLDLEAEDYDW